jgi:glycerate kinase
LVDAAGGAIPDGGAGLLRLDRVDVGGLTPAARTVRVVAATDVDNPLVGPNGAAHVFAPQKSASDDDVRLLDRALRHFAAVLDRDLGVDVRELPGAGAGGGTGAGLVGLLGAHLRRGVEVVIEAVELPRRIAEADVVLTGEGRLDATTFGGKVVAGVLEVSARARVPAGVLCGRADVRPDAAWVGDLIGLVGERRAFEDARAAIEELAAEAAAELGGLSSPA